ncbi:hypothetical protein BD413DRAFT_614219 [Trametes elegans]|nr:hypothetical protein BD413DRAFT_614219 [Trametes elegans]
MVAEAAATGKARSSSRQTRSAISAEEAGPVASSSTARSTAELVQRLDCSAYASGSGGSCSHEWPASSAIVAEGAAQVSERNLVITDVALPFVYHGHVPQPLPAASPRPSPGMAFLQPSWPATTTTAGMAAGSPNVWRPDAMLEAGEGFISWPAAPLAHGASAALDRRLHVPAAFQEPTPQDEFWSVTNSYGLDNVAIDSIFEEILREAMFLQGHDLCADLASSFVRSETTHGFPAQAAVATTVVSAASAASTFPPFSPAPSTAAFWRSSMVLSPKPWHYLYIRTSTLRRQLRRLGMPAVLCQPLGFFSTEAAPSVPNHADTV